MKTYKVETIYDLIQSGSSLKVTVPGSKSITNRALLLATLAQGESRLSGVLFSDDSRHFLDCVQKLGFETSVSEERAEVTVTGRGGMIPNANASLYVGSAGTAARFLTALLGVSEGSWHLDSSEQMKRRPMAPLLQTLEELGAVIRYEGQEGYFPYTLTGNPRPGTAAAVNIDRSSQFLSALLIAYGALGEEGRISVEGSHGMAYIDMTIRMMEQFGVQVKKEGSTFVIEAGQHYQPLAYPIEPDVSAACYFYAMAPLLGISVVVRGVHFDSMQGDVQFIRLLEQMGCHAVETDEGIRVSGNPDGSYCGIDAGMHACSDQAITMAAIAPFASTPTTIRGVAHIRLQESDRIGGIVKELSAMGIRCEELEDGVKIWPGIPKPHEVETYDDHRMAMGFSLIGLRAEGIVIRDPLCCRKTFETYFTVLDQLICQWKADSREKE